MAFSQLTDEAQSPALCQFCEESTDITWKCINCDVFMCQVYDTAISEMKDFQNKLESCYQLFEDENKNLEKLLIDGDKNYQEIKDNIFQTEREITKTVSKYAKELLEDLESIWKPSENTIKTELADIQKNKENLSMRKESLKKTLQSHQASEIFSSRKTLDKNLPTKSMETFISKCSILKTKFISGNLLEKQNTRKTILGDLYAVPDFEIVKSYQSIFLNVRNILNCESNAAFIACSKEKKVQKVKFEENNMKLEEDIITSVNGMTKLKNERILLSSGEGGLKVYSSDKQFKPFKSFPPLKTLSVHVSQNNEIFVGLTECIPVKFPAIEDSVRRLIVLNQDGDLEHTYEYDKDNKRLFTSPRRIVTLYDNIYVIDQFQKDLEGRVLVFNCRGQIMWTYKGCDIKIDTGKFYPSDIAVNSDGMFFISDQRNHSIHVLNSTGEVIVYKDVKALGIELPLSLSIDSNSILWIGCNTLVSDKSSKAKIFAVKLV